MAVFAVCLLFRYGIHLYASHNQAMASMEQVLESGELVVATRESVHTYLRHGDTVEGLGYELSRMLASELGVTLKMIPVPTCEAALRLVENGTAALAIPAMPLDRVPSRSLRKSLSYMQVRQHLVVGRKDFRLRALKDLEGRTVHLPQNASARKWLEIERERQQLDFTIKEVPGACSQDLFRMVGTGDVDITVSPEHMALRNRRYHPGTLISAPVGPAAPMTFVAGKNAIRLRFVVDRFITRNLENGTIAALRNEYYADMDSFDYVDLVKFHQRLESRLPKYAHIIKKAADTHGFDWRLIAAQSYQESHYNPWARSHARARGLMQLIPRTARSLGVSKIYDPHQNVEAGVRMLRRLHNRFRMLPEPDRTRMALAAYNAGEGHLSDARKLTARLGRNPDRWPDVARTFPLLQLKKYYKDATYGYCRGSEPVKYVRQIQTYLDILRHRDLLVRQGVRSAASTSPPGAHHGRPTRIPASLETGSLSFSPDDKTPPSRFSKVAFSVSKPG